MRGLVVPDAKEDFTADPVELFFDLAFVFAFSQLVAHLVHYPTWTGAGEVALLFAIIWFAWSWFTWVANGLSGNGRPIRTIFLVATAITVPMAASVDTAFGSGGAIFAVCAAAILLGANVLGVITHEIGSDHWRSAIALAAPTSAALVLLTIGGLVEGNWRIAIWLAALMIVIAATVAAGGGDWIVRSGHFAERHGLILIIALGEVIVAIGIAVVSDFDEGGLGRDTGIGLGAAGVLAGLLWWSYFDRVLPALEHRSEALEPRQRGKYARDVYTYGHAPIICGIIVAAAAAEEMLLHPSDHPHVEFRWMLAIGLAMFLGGISFTAFRAFGVLAKERAVGILAIAVVCALAGSWPGIWLLIAVDVVLFAMLVAEHWRIEIQPRSETST